MVADSNKPKAVFIDRDGTIAIDGPYCKRPEDFKFFDGAPEAIAALSKAGFLIVIVTNQSGVARGLFTHDDVRRIHEKMCREIEVVGGKVDAVYYCPHHPDEKCNCRKPGVALIERAIGDFVIDMKKSYVVGDQIADMALPVKCKKVLVYSPDTEKNIDEFGISFKCKTFAEAAEWILKRQRS